MKETSKMIKEEGNIILEQEKRFCSRLPMLEILLDIFGSTLANLKMKWAQKLRHIKKNCLCVVEPTWLQLVEGKFS